MAIQSKKTSELDFIASLEDGDVLMVVRGNENFQILKENLPAGPVGPVGNTGPQGATGPQGPNGVIANDTIGVAELKPIFKDTQIIVITSGAITIDFSLAIVHYIHITENITAQTWNNYTLAKADWLCVTFADPTKTIGGFPAGVNTADLKAFNKTTPTTENWISVNTLKTSPPLFLLSNTVK